MAIDGIREIYSPSIKISGEYNELNIGFLRRVYTWGEFIELNLIACKQLSELDKSE